MSRGKDGISRRCFLGGAALAAGGMCCRRSARAEGPATPGLPSPQEIADLAGRVPTRRQGPQFPQFADVVIVTDRRVLGADGQMDPAILRTMLHKALLALSGKAAIADAYRAWFGPQDLVAVKYNEMGGPALETSPALRGILAEDLRQQAGLGADRLVFIGRSSQYRGQYAGWAEPAAIRSTGGSAKLCNLIARHATGIVNLPVCKTHKSQGLTCALKNHVGSVGNSGDFCGEEDWPRLWKNVPELNSLPAIRDKTRLVIVDALRPQYLMGPTPSPAHRVSQCSLIVSTDPVAADACALGMLDGIRKAKGLPPVAFGPPMLALAEALGVGVAQPGRIKVTAINLTGGQGT